jgi:sulfite reductase (NADPH) hemoprotein beta-component
VAPHKNPAARRDPVVQAPGPGRRHAEQLDALADLADRFSAGEARVTHDQNLLLPWVRQRPAALWQGRARPAWPAQHRPADRHDRLPRRRLLRAGQCALDPGGGGHHRALPGPGRTDDLGEIDLHISGCINSCGHHHSGHIGILGVDKDGKEWYQITLGGADGSAVRPAVAARWSAPRSRRPKCPT